MSTDRKKQLREEAKKHRPEMGVYAIEDLTTKTIRLGTSTNLKSIINRTLFQLNAGLHPNAALQREWKELGESGFPVRIIETLLRDEDEAPGTDCAEELKTLLELCLENFEGTQKI